MYGSRLDDQLDHWRASAEIDPGSVEGAIDEGLSARIEQIRKTAAAYPADAFAEFVTLTSFLNVAASLRTPAGRTLGAHRPSGGRSPLANCLTAA
jgi:hypothetical protein